MGDTKIEEDDQDVSSPQIDTPPQESTGTKLGHVSDFEKDLIQNEVIEESSSRLDSNEGEVSEDNMLDAALDEKTLDCFEGQIVTARVRLLKKSGVLVDFSYISDGFIPSNEITEAVFNELSEGDEIQAMIEKLETKEGYSLLSEKSARGELIWDDLIEVMNKKEPVSVTVLKVNQNGYLVQYDAVRGFLHAEEGKELKEKDVVKVLILNIDKRRGKIMFSMRNVEDVVVKKQELTAFLDTISEGDTITGTVSGIKKFGVFVNFGTAEGLVHISEISWRRLSHPSDVVTLGDQVEVQVLTIDKAEGKLSLGMKQLIPDPWLNVEDTYEYGQVVDGKVIRVTSFGAFVLINNSLEGLVHISEIAAKRIQRLEEVLFVGDLVKAKILKISKGEQKIGLSLKEVEQDNQELVQRIEAL